MGLLHDIGKLVLLQIIGELSAKSGLGDSTEMAQILQTLDTFHSQFGALLLKRWQFPACFIQIAMYHDRLKDAKDVSKDLLVVHFSNLLVKSIGYHLDADFQESSVDDVESARLLQLDQKSVSSIKNDVQLHVADLKQMLT